MGFIYASNGVGVKKSAPVLSTTRGLVRAKKAFRFDGTKWVEFWGMPDDKPKAPSILTGLVIGSSKLSVAVTVRESLDLRKINRVIVKVGVGDDIPNNPRNLYGFVSNNTTSNYSFPSGSYTEPFSEFWSMHRGDVMAATPNQSMTVGKIFPPAGVTLKDNTRYNFVVWVEDEYHNWSDPVVSTIYSPKAAYTPPPVIKPAPAPAPAPKPAPAPQPTPAPAPAVRYVNKEFTPQWWGTYKGDNRLYDYGERNNSAYQGVYPNDTYRNGNLKSLIGFGDIGAAIGRREITRAQVYVYMKHWYWTAGGILHVRMHHNLNKPSTYNEATGVVAAPKYTKREQGLWFDLPSWLFWGLANSHDKGISLHTSSTSGTYYGSADPMRTRLLITYKA